MADRLPPSTNKAKRPRNSDKLDAILKDKEAMARTRAEAAAVCRSVHFTSHACGREFASKLAQCRSIRLHMGDWDFMSRRADQELVEKAERAERRIRKSTTSPRRVASVLTRSLEERGTRQ